MKIGVTGRTGAGKTTFVDYLTLKGFNHISLSDLIRDELDLRNIELTRLNLQNVGNELRQKYGSDFWARKAIGNMRCGQNY